MKPGKTLWCLECAKQKRHVLAQYKHQGDPYCTSCRAALGLSFDECTPIDQDARKLEPVLPRDREEGDEVLDRNGDRPKCSFPQCQVRLIKSSKNGRCSAHQPKADESRECTEEDQAAAEPAAAQGLVADAPRGTDDDHTTDAIRYEVAGRRLFPDFSRVGHVQPSRSVKIKVPEWWLDDWWQKLNTDEKVQVFESAVN